ncbi:MAG: hypothetical protein JXB38_11485 [Anaerolineales bacterium]|nr:hypothetical protein [Anaerolineales bacterium]
MLAPFSLREDYWETFTLEDSDVEFIYNHLLEIETPLSPEAIIKVLVEDRLRREKQAVERQRSAGGEVYLPKDHHDVGEKLVFPARSWQTGEVTAVRPARTYAEDKFSVIEVEFEGGTKQEFASDLQDHALNIPPEVDENDPLQSSQAVLENYSEMLEERLIEGLQDNDDFVYIAGRWFPKALLVDVNVGNLNLAEAVLDIEGGGPLPTAELMEQVEMPEGVNPKLAEFSLDRALQEDPRFDEVGSAGEVSWFLQRLEPEEVRSTPIFLRYHEIDYDRDLLTEEMLALERSLDDELSPIQGEVKPKDEIQVSLIYPHWRAGTLPLTPSMSELFPTAYESPRIRCILIDADTGEKFPGWVVRLEKYVYGLREWYLERGVMPGSYIKVRRGENPGEMIVKVESHRSAKEWVRTALIGADGGVVYAMLKQPVSTSFDDRMMIAMPAEVEPLDMTWEKRQKSRPPFEQIVVDTLRELAKLNPQSHVHITELYSATNVVLRCPPGPILTLLASRPWFVHVGDFHFRFDDSAKE